jgi:hypothetical protein
VWRLVLPFLAILLLVVVSPALAASSPVPVTWCSGASYYSLQYGTKASIASGCIYATSKSASYSPPFVQFTQASTSAGGPYVPTLRWVSSGSSSNVTSITGGQVRFSMGGAGDLFYYYSSNITQVEYSLNNVNPTVFQQSSFFDSYASGGF